MQIFDKNYIKIANIYYFNKIFINPTNWYLFVILELDFLIVSEFHHFATLLHLYNDQVVQNIYKLIIIAKTYRFHSLFEIVIIYLKNII